MDLASLCISFINPSSECRNRIDGLSDNHDTNSNAVFYRHSTCIPYCFFVGAKMGKDQTALHRFLHTNSGQSFIIVRII